MNAKTRIGLITAVALALAVALGAMIPASGTPRASSNANRPQNPRTVGRVLPGPEVAQGVKVLSLSTMDFAPDSIRYNNLDYFNQWGFSGSSLGGELSNDESLRCFNASVHLPDGAVLASITFYYRSGPNTDFYGTMVRQELATGTTSRFIEVFPADDSGVLASITVAVPASQSKIDNRRFAYAIGVCPFDDSTFDGALITYSS